MTWIVHSGSCVLSSDVPLTITASSEEEAIDKYVSYLLDNGESTVEVEMQRNIRICSHPSFRHKQ